jgi:hypothetical protein
MRVPRRRAGADAGLRALGFGECAVCALDAGARALVFPRAAAVREAWVLERLGEHLFCAHERALTLQVAGGGAARWGAPFVDGPRQPVNASTVPAIRPREPKNGTRGPVNASVNPRARARRARSARASDALWPGVSLSGGSATAGVGGRCADRASEATL